MLYFTPSMVFLGIFMMTLLAIALQRLHLLSVLLLLEALILITATWLMTSNSLTTPFLLLFILTPAVCEATIGLALFITLMRTSGNDLMKSTSLMKW